MNQDQLTLEVRGVHKSFESPGRSVEVLRGADLDAAGGQSLAITGPSGSGKSTLLHLIGTLDAPTSGTIKIRGENPLSLGEVDQARFRNRTIGFIFQDHHLLPQYSVLENVLLPTLAFDDVEAGGEARARELLERVGLGHRLGHRPSELSGGERQRTAVARALINAPDLLLCDEPTGSLDQETARTVSDLLFELHREEKTILILVTHSLDLAAMAERRIELKEGRCVER